MTKFKKVLSKIYYYTWRILLIIILCCLSVYSIANTVNYFVDRNKLVESSVSDIQKSVSDIQKLVNPSNNPQGFVSYCPLVNYFSYNDRADYVYDFSNLIYNNQVIGQYNLCGNVLTIKDFTGDVLQLDLPYLEDLTNDSYVFALKYYSSYYDELHIEWAFNDGGSEVIFEDFTYGYITTGSFNPSGSQYIVVEYGNTPFQTPNLIQFEFYIFKSSDVINYFHFPNISYIGDYLLSSNIFVPFGFDYIQGQENNYFYDSKYIEGLLDDKYHDGYNAGYDAGRLVGYNEGYVDGKQDGDSIGYDRGYYDGSHDDTSVAFQHGYNAGLTAQFNKGGFLGLANLIFNAPYNILHEVFNFEFLGVNLWGLMSFAFTTALIFAVIKLFM